MNPDDKQIEKWWDELEDIPFIETMNGKLLLSTNWLNFKAGTEREDIWHWFDAVHSKGVYYLLYEREE